MSDKTDGSAHDPQQLKGKKNRSVLDKAINAVTEAFKNGSAETTMAHWPDIGVETDGNGRAPSQTQESGDEDADGHTITYTFEPVEKLEKNSKDKKKKKKKDKKKQKKLEKKLAEKLKKKEKKAQKKLKKEAKRGAVQGLADNVEHGFNEPGPYGPGGI